MHLRSPYRAFQRRAAAGLAVWTALLAGALRAEDGQRELSQSSMPCVITNAGSYLLTENLRGIAGYHGITIAADNVLLDLNGFTLTGIPGTHSGIYVAEQRRGITVRNGSVDRWDKIGIEAGCASNSAFVNLILANCKSNGMVTGYGCTVVECKACGNAITGIEVENGSTVSRCSALTNGEHGIAVHSGTTVEDCILHNNGHDGIHGSHGVTIVRCTAYENAGEGIEGDSGSLIADCTVRHSEDGIKLRTGGGCVVNCSVYSNFDDGIDVDLAPGSVVRDCHVWNNDDEGIAATYSSFITGNVCVSNGLRSASGGSGVRVSGEGNKVEGNHLTGNKVGLSAYTSGNFISGNTARNNTSANYSVADGNEYELVSDPGGSFPASPWVNFKY
jgi:parallel beta-helix repeat protein